MAHLKLISRICIDLGQSRRIERKLLIEGTLGRSSLRDIANDARLVLKR